MPHKLRIPGTTKPVWMKENIRAAAIDLASEDLREIDDAKFTVQGERYPEELERLTYR
jgi:diketogulonate reductase-like aldo/keto reductase